jgi:L-glutamine-phosphate cytidylyltransferase
MHLLILASGRGSRLKKATSKHPKCFVKVKQKKIIDYIAENFYKFEDIIIATGYKSSLLKKKFPQAKFAHNKYYLTTNMVYSMFCSSSLIKKDVIVSYSDIIFDPLIINKMINFKPTHMPLFKNWEKYWKKRMKTKDINFDAENLITKKNKILSIGEKILDKRPRLQFMGLIRLKYNDFFKLKKFFNKINKPKIDMTSFINLAINNKVISMNFFETSKFWFEIDNQIDKKVAEKMLKKIKFK